MTDPTRYRYRDLKPGDAYYDAWGKVRGAQRFSKIGDGVMVLAVLLGTPLYGVIILPLQLLCALIDETCRGGYRGPAGFFYGHSLMIVWVLISIALGFEAIGYFRLRKAYCPRCGSRRIVTQSILGERQRCEGCGLPKWAPDDPDKETADA